MKQNYFLILLLCLTLSSCATSDYESSDQQQGPSGMSGGGMGPGGGRGSQQGPPNMDGSDSDNEMPLPEAAFTACLGKKEGDYVVLELAPGKEIKATCTLMNDQMIAIPQENKKKGRR